jgi:hypothetical protein
MVVSPLAQLVTIAALAYASGLLLGLAVYRGEIGPRRGRAPMARAEPATTSTAPSPAPRGRRRGLLRKLRKLRRQMPELSVNLQRYVTGLAVLAVLIALALFGVQTVLGADSQPVAPHGSGIVRP